MTTLRKLAEDIRREQLTIPEAAVKGAAITLPERVKEPDGEIWLRGNEDNSTVAVYEELELSEATEFLKALARARES